VILLPVLYRRDDRSAALDLLRRESFSG
jgi:hypothetical protein